MMTESALQQDTGKSLPQALPDPFPATNMDALNVATPDLVCDCRRMLRYASKNGMLLVEQLVNDIAKLDSILVDKRMEPVSDVAQALVAPWSGAADAGSADAGRTTPGPVNAQVLLLMVHQELSALITPATALTLAVSEPSPGKHRLMGGVPLVVKGAALVAVICALLFMTTAHLLATTDNIADTAQGDAKGAHP
ncbi:hypothetical protein [Massilia rubra]|uniref:Uncharacterized protein n=1 Tax=Massilia rubra TaxID=2607910 RepID=A0ABX0LPF2_9BURK|nr:hypothetical protein [Massilia rubra]NHZ33334.1 hypothetical protein [Massilia rubra]